MSSRGPAGPTAPWRATRAGSALNAAALAADLTEIQTLLDAGTPVDARDKVR